MKLLEVQGFSKRFFIHHLGREIRVFENLSFDLAPGAFLLVSGPNGAGKSSLLRCLYRSYLPSGGRALYHSSQGWVDLAKAPDPVVNRLRLSEIGYVSQFLRPRPRVSAVELVAEPLRFAGWPAAEALAEACRWLEDFGLKPGLWEAYPSTFSGGEQQKVNLARALIAPRRLLILDEPTASLDTKTRRALAERLARLKRDGVAMIGVFHHPEDIEGLADAQLEIGPMEELPDVVKRA